MKLSLKGKIAINSVTILTIIVGCTLLVINEVLYPVVFILLIPICSPLAICLYHEVMIAKHNIERKLKRHLPKIGCTIESIEHVDNSDTTRIVGKFKDETLVFDIAKDNPFLTIWDPAWFGIAYSDPNYPMFIEAANKTNIMGGATIVFSCPDKDGFRTLHTFYRTIIPNMHISEFLNIVLLQVLLKKMELRENLKEYPWLKQKRKKPMGFTMTEEKDTEQEAKQESTIAAQGESTIDDDK